MRAKAIPGSPANPSTMRWSTRSTDRASATASAIDWSARGSTGLWYSRSLRRTTGSRHLARRGAARVRRTGQHANSIAAWSTAVDDPAQSELRAALEAAIADLPAAHRAIILLRDVRGVERVETASVSRPKA